MPVASEGSVADMDLCVGIPTPDAASKYLSRRASEGSERNGSHVWGPPVRACQARTSDSSGRSSRAFATRSA